MAQENKQTLQVSQTQPKISM